MTLTRRQLLQAGGLGAAWMLVPQLAFAGAQPSRTPTGGISPSFATWVGANRVHGTTRLNVGRWGDTPEFSEAAAGFRALGAHTFSRHVKSGAEDPWDRAIVQAVIDEAHGQGLRMIAYYWHMSEATMATLHPEWVCKLPDRITPVEGPRGVYLDVTGPYGDVVLDRLFELAAMGVDGFKFDHVHLPRRGCWGTALEAAWVAETGLPAPAAIDDADPLYRRYIDFKARKVEETFRYWSSRVKAQSPHVAFFVSAPTIPALTDRENTTELLRIADCPKNEYHHAIKKTFNKSVFEDNPDLAVPAAHVRMALGWTVLRDAADGRPSTIWAGGLPDIHHATAFAASLVTFGCIASIDVAEPSLLGREDPPPGKTPLDGVRAAFALGDAVSPSLADAQPLRWAALHFSERNRNARGADYRAAWQQVLWPLVGAYGVLSARGLPAGIVTDKQLADRALDGYRVLILPNPGGLTARQQAAVAAFTKNGGVVIANDPRWQWSDPARTDAAAAAFWNAVSPYSATAPVHVSGPPGRYAVSYRSANRLVVAVTNDFSWVQVTDADVEDPDAPPIVINPPAPPLQGVRVTWRRDLGGGVVRPLHAVEVIQGKRLVVDEVPGGYRVRVPTFAHMALVAVSY